MLQNVDCEMHFPAFQYPVEVNSTFFLLSQKISICFVLLRMIKATKLCKKRSPNQTPAGSQ